MDLLHVTPSCNLPGILREGLVPQIGINSLAAGEETPGVYLFQCWDDVETALLNWLGEEFGDIPLSLLCVRVQEAFLIHEPGSFEYVCRSCIPPEDIQVIATL